MPCRYGESSRSVVPSLSVIEPRETRSCQMLASICGKRARRYSTMVGGAGSNFGRYKRDGRGCMIGENGNTSSDPQYTWRRPTSCGTRYSYSEMVCPRLFLGSRRFPASKAFQPKLDSVAPGLGKKPMPGDPSTKVVSDAVSTSAP